MTEAMEIDQPTEPPPLVPTDDSEQEWIDHLRSVDRILVGEVTVGLHQEFLIRNNHTDLQILKNIKVHPLPHTPSHITHITRPHTSHTRGLRR